MSERIKQAALLMDAGHVLWTAPRPARHNDLIHSWCQTQGAKRVDPHASGFVTDSGRFVGRREAADIARAAGQVEAQKRTNPQYMLFSEDLW